MRTFLTLAALVFLTGCARDSAAQVVEQTQDAKKPVDDVKAPVDEKPIDWAKEIAAMKPIEPIDHEKLLPFLPKAPAGYQVREPYSDSAEFEAQPYHTDITYTIKYTFAEALYRNGDKSVSVKILDAAKIDAFYKWIPETAALKKQTEAGHELGLTIGADPALEKYRKDEQRTDLTVMMGKRFHIEIITKGAPPEFAQVVLKSIDRAKLTALK